MRRCRLILAAAAAAAAVEGVNALDPAPVSIPSGDWLGIDGNWSTVQFLLGTQADIVNVIPSTSISEFWAVGPSGCQHNEQHCITARGGIYTPTSSKRWSSWGRYVLGLLYLGYGGNGLYGLDNINAYSPITNIAFGMSNVLIAAYNTTDFFTGFFGLGISRGRFRQNVAKPAMVQAVETFGWIPSYSYGYTAGASYRNMPVSLTLGGYDASRLVDHDTPFTMTTADLSLRLNVRGISVYNQNNPHNWGSSTSPLSTYNDTFMALIDSSTPYLWLPGPICDAFASALNLTYNSTFQLYTINNDQYRDYSISEAYTFTFSLASPDNHDNFGLPLSAPGVVNITIPIRSFIGFLQFPFQKQAIKYGQPAVPYFMLRKASESSGAIIGRSFLQESYLRTKFDSGIFSIHQAAFPTDPIDDAKLRAIRQPRNSPLQGPPPTKGRGLATVKVIGIVVGVTVLCTILATLWFCRRRCKAKKSGEAVVKEAEAQDTSSTIAPDSPLTPMSRILSKIVRKKRSKHAATATVDRSGPMEAPASEIYELPAPMPPAELAAHDEDGFSVLGDTEAGTDDSQNLSAYEVARRKMDRQLAGPVPAYSPPENGVLPMEKGPDMGATDDIRTTTITQISYRHHSVSPVRSQEGLGTNSLPGTLPSPVSPRTDWNTNELPSPITASPHPASSRAGSTGHRGTQSNGASRSNSNSSSNSNGRDHTREAHVSPSLVQTASQRTPIEPSKVVCLGPLPEDVSLYRQQMLSSSGATPSTPGGPTGPYPSQHRPSTGSLGSNFTDEENAMAEEMTRLPAVSITRPDGSSRAQRPINFSNPLIRTTLLSRTEEEENVSPTSDLSGASSEDSSGRINGADLIHVPQMAERRYSWEEQ